MLLSVSVLKIGVVEFVGFQVIFVQIDVFAPLLREVVQTASNHFQHQFAALLLLLKHLSVVDGGLFIEVICGLAHLSRVVHCGIWRHLFAFLRRHFYRHFTSILCSNTALSTELCAIMHGAHNSAD